MICKRCKGRCQLDRTFVDNKNYEVFCLLCGGRWFINKESEVGKWLTTVEERRKTALMLP